MRGAGYTVERYTPDDAAAWDEFVAGAPMATLLHTRRYLGYHGDRFDDRSLLLRDMRGRLAAVFPAAIDRDDDRVVVSHAGVTYGGLVHTGALVGERALQAVAAIAAHYAEERLAKLIYKAVPRIYHQRPCEDDLYALFRHGAGRYRVDLSCAIDIEHRGRRSERRRRGERKAERAGAVVDWDPAHLRPFWNVLAENLAQRHSLRPVHSPEELHHLMSLFPEEIQLATAHLEGEVVAGTLLFVTPMTMHAQYIGSSERGRDIAALDVLIEACIRRAAKLGVRYFNFGVSTERNGVCLNTSLHQFKVEFGGAGVVHDFYELDLPISRPRAS